MISLTLADARTEAVRCEQDAAAARKAGREAWAVLHDARRQDRLTVATRCSELLETLEPAQATRREWEALTADTRRIALAADLELKRRAVIDPEEAMKSSEPEGLVPGDLADDKREHTIREALGRALFHTQQYSEAAEEFRAVATHAPTNDYALFCLGRCLQLLGRHAEAQEPLAQAAAMGPSRRDYALYRDRARAAAA